jgi:hypothetical protein
MSYLLVALLALIGLGTLFIVPWVGAGLLALALVGALVVVVGSVFAGAAGERDTPVNTGLPGPGSPDSGVQTDAREL